MGPSEDQNFVSQFHKPISIALPRETFLCGYMTPKLDIIVIDPPSFPLHHQCHHQHYFPHHLLPSQHLCDHQNKQSRGGAGNNGVCTSYI